MAMVKLVDVFVAKIVGALATVTAAGVLIGAVVTFWNQNATPVVDHKSLSCSSPEVVEGARTVFFKALVVNIFNQMGGQTNPDRREGMEVAVGMCVDDLARDHAKSAECAGWLKALNEIRLIHITTTNYFDNGSFCRGMGLLTTVSCFGNLNMFS